MIRFPPGLQPFRPCTGLSTLLDLRSATIVSRAFSCRSPRDWLGLQARERPDAPALTWRGQTLDYASLARAARQWAGALEAAGLGPGQVLGLSTTDPWLTVAALYGSLQAGVVLLPLDPALAPQRRALLLSQAGCTRLLSDRAVPPPIRHLSPDVLLCPGGPPPSRAAGTGAGCGIIIATSGTSGEPKGVMLTMANIAAAVGAARRRIPLGPGDCWLDPLPLFHIGGLSVFFRALEAGAGVLLDSGFDALRLLDTLARQRVTHLSLVPPMLARLLEAGDGRAPPALRAVLIGGGPLDPALAARAQAAGWPLCVSYGMSETASQLATACGPEAGRVAGAVGRPLAGFEVQINGRRVESGVGPIRVRGPAVMAGYANPALEPGEGLQDGWYQTGDLGSLDREGRLTLVGRADEILVSGGRNIHPAEVEARVLACPGVREAAVRGEPDPLWGDRLALFYSGVLDETALEAWLRAHLPGSLRPRILVRLAALPRGPMGKVRRDLLRRPESAAPGDDDQGASR